MIDPGLNPAKHRRGIDQAEDQRVRLVRADNSEPGQIKKGRAEKRDEETIAARRLDPEDTDARGFGEFDRQHREGDEQRRNDPEKDRGRKCSSHPRQIHRQYSPIPSIRSIASSSVSETAKTATAT